MLLSPWHASSAFSSQELAVFGARDIIQAYVIVSKGCTVMKRPPYSHMEQYLGPSILQICHLFVLVVVNSMTLFAVSILLISALWGLGVNTTTIEGWEIERHEVLSRRARKTGGYVTGLNGVQIKIKHQEFPYDVGIWRNLWQGMGSKNVSPSCVYCIAFSYIHRYSHGFGHCLYHCRLKVVSILKLTNLKVNQGIPFRFLS